jgi:hypothetical protein
MDALRVVPDSREKYLSSFILEFMIVCLIYVHIHRPAMPAITVVKRPALENDIERVKPHLTDHLTRRAGIAL